MSELVQNESSDLGIGLLFAFASIIFYGSFAVPIKSKRVIDAKVDPLLFQLYKSIASFIFSLILLLFHPWYWTWWAFLGSAIWVLTGTVAIFAVQRAGLICQSIWSCIPVFVSSLVGVLLFGEMPRSPFFAIIGLVGIASGLIGLGRVLSKSHNNHNSNNTTSELGGDNDDDDERPLVVAPPPPTTTTTTKGGGHLPGGVLRLLPPPISKILLNNKVVTGLAATVVVGLLNAIHMVPFRIAQKTDGITSEDYIIPFATSALIVTLLAIGFKYGVVLKERPMMHIDKVAGPALLCGLLWSLGNFSTVHAVANLGLAVGYSLTQVQLLVSTAWAVLFYKEIPLVKETVVVFLGSTVCIIVGMVLLSLFG